MSLESTVQYVQAAGFYQPLRRRTVPRGKPSLLPEVDYARRLVAWVDELAAAFAELPRMLEPGSRFDSHQGPAHAPPGEGAVLIRLDESRHGRRVRQITEPVRRKVDRDTFALEPEIQRAGRAVAASHKAVLDRQTRAALGVEIPTLDQRVPGQIESFVSKNMTRIRRLGDKLVGEVETLVIDAFDRGLSADELALEIESRIGVAKTYARFLARDQMNALYSQVTRARHEELGVRLFRWWTEGDNNVRSSHAVKHKRIFPYKGSRAPSFFPGEEHGCRCWEEPVFDEIKAKAFAGKGRQRVGASAPVAIRQDQQEGPVMRIAIAGGPRCGKTTFAAKLGEARHTDDLIGAMDWSAASTEVATWFDAAGPWIIEGVAVPRALRKWLAAHPDGKPCDVVHWLIEPHVELTTGQAAMLKGCVKVWNEIVGELRRRGVELRHVA